MSRTTSLITVVCLTLIVSPCSWGQRPDGRPNVIVIMADDMGFADVGFTGSTDIQTPNLDKLAASGVTFTNAYVTHPYCGPSRAGLLSGRYQHRFGFETNPAYDPSNPYLGIDIDQTLFPKRLQQAGYRTAAIGKWHLGAAAPFHPMKRGFDYFYGFLGGGHDYFKIDLRQPVKEGYLQALERNGKPAEFEGYLTTALSRDAASFVRSCSKDVSAGKAASDKTSGKQSQPFFMYVAYNAPHAPLQAPEADIKRYSRIKDRKRQVYAAMVDVMDAGIGLIIDALNETGARDNTLVFFLSDNGGPQATAQNPGKWNGSSNGTFRGGKGNLYDGGVHVPFIASWPAQINAGTTFDSPVISLDIAATAAACGGLPDDVIAQLEGVNLLPILSNVQQGPPHDFLYWREGGNSARWSVLSAQGHKYVLDQKGKRPELFHLPADMSEANDLAASEPKRARSLLERWNSWNQANLPSRLGNYKAYHALRDQFFLDSIPSRATDGGYQPNPHPTFRK